MMAMDNASSCCCRALWSRDGFPLRSPSSADRSVDAACVAVAASADAVADAVAVAVAVAASVAATVNDACLIAGA